MSTPASLIVKHPDPAKVNASFLPTLQEAQGLKIVDLASATRAGAILQALKGAVKFLKEGDPSADWEGFDGPVKAAFDGHKFLVKLRDMAIKPYEDGHAALNTRLLAWEVEERRKAEEAQRAAEAEAKRAEEDRLLREAEAAQAQGDHAAAEQILSEPVYVPAPLAPALPKIEGRSVRENFKAEVFDVLALARHVIAHPEDAALLEPNMPAINARARSQRKGFNLPGCRLVVERIASTKVG